MAFTVPSLSIPFYPQTSLDCFALEPLDRLIDKVDAPRR